jgi:uncharacterized protein (DUF1684 family)
MKTLFLLSLITIFAISCEQKPKETSAYEKEFIAFQDTLNAQYANPKESPLMEKDLPDFKGLDFYPIDKKYRVEATFTKVADTTPFKMKTSTDRAPLYAKYGKVNFTLEGKDIELFVYQSVKYRTIEKYKDELSLPYKDLTSGKTSYGGGRYVDLKIPESNTIVIDFNKTYNPYCAYNHKYSCVIPPPENFIDLEIKAGTMKYGKH